ncbi:MAG: diacylglycerol/lipid kinase family protein [Bacteroidales bacterium]|jgi:YegS/Rv2252/BmrU family lipid kinase
MEETIMRPEWCAIFNPNAGNAKGSKDSGRISDILRKNGINFNALTTTGKGDATEFTRTMLAEGYRKIISVGGDGTLNEIINGVFTQTHCLPSEVTIGLIPVGTGNDWGRMFGIPLVYEGAVSVIKEGKTLLHDIGVIDYHIGSAKHRTYFINIAGTGFEAVVILRTNRQKEKGRSNKAIYLFNLLRSLITYRNTPVEITIDGITSNAKIFSINIGNGR